MEPGAMERKGGTRIGAGAPPEPSPWMRRPGPPAGAGLPDLAFLIPGEPELPCGIERRLPRRAEALWNRLRAGDGLPPAGAAGRLLATPFAAQSLLLARPTPGAEAEIAYCGADLAALADAGADGLRPDPAPGASVPARLAALALEAIAAGAPRYLDSDLDPDLPRQRPPLLFRAVALPLAPGPGAAGGSAMAVVSWRRLLSPAETADLHRELAAAIGWLSASSAPLSDHP
jgi:hypothetical protein